MPKSYTVQTSPSHAYSSRQLLSAFQICTLVQCVSFLCTTNRHWHRMLTPRHITVNTTNAFSSSNNNIPHIQLCSMCKYLPSETEIWGARYVAETKASKSRWTVKEQTTQPCFCCFCKHYKRLFCAKMLNRQSVSAVSQWGSCIQPLEVSTDRDSCRCILALCRKDSQSRMFRIQMKQLYETMTVQWSIRVCLFVYWGILGNAAENITKQTHAALAAWQDGLGEASPASLLPLLDKCVLLHLLHVVLIRKPQFI